MHDDDARGRPWTEPLWLLDELYMCGRGGGGICFVRGVRAAVEKRRKTKTNAEGAKVSLRALRGD